MTTALLVATSCGWAAPYQVYDDRIAFLEALGSARVLNQDFSGLAAQTNLNGSEVLPGVTVNSSFDTLIVWGGNGLFGFDDHTRMLGQGYYEFSLQGYNAVGFDIGSWDPAAPGPARVGIFLGDGTVHEVERWQRGPTEQTPVFFGVIAEQPIVKIRWHEGPEVYGGGNEEVTVDNLVCAGGTPCETLVAGVWEPDVYTGHAARLSIRQDRDCWFIHGYGSCSPAFCDWGEVPLNRVSPYNPGAFDGWFGVWEFGFKTTYLKISLQCQGLKVEYIDIFHDYSGRAGYSVLSPMHRVPSNTLAITRNAADGAIVVNSIRESGVKLQECNDLSCAQWTDVPLADGEDTYYVPEGSPMRFFRLVRP